MKAINKFKKEFERVRVTNPNHFELAMSYGTAFISYDSIVAFRPYSDEPLVLGAKWDYSRTTMKYLGQWLGSNAKEIRAGIERGTITYDEEL